MLVPAIAAVPGLGRLVPRIIDRRWPGVRSSVVARTRLIDDTIERTLAAQIERVIILGAGFDSRAYRLPAFAASPCSRSTIRIPRRASSRSWRTFPRSRRRT
jgi:leucine carboxyl methyltransferase